MLFNEAELHFLGLGGNSKMLERITKDEYLVNVYVKDQYDGRIFLHSSGWKKSLPKLKGIIFTLEKLEADWDIISVEILEHEKDDE